MYPGRYARETPDKPAVVMAGTGETVTYLELDRRSNRLAQLWYARGLRPEDHVAIFMENHPRYFEVYWAAIRSGLYLTTVNRYLTAEEAAYIVKDCGARSIVASAKLAEACAELTDLIPTCPGRLIVDDDGLGAPPGWDDYGEATAAFPAEPLAEQPRGGTMLYSSGTTGRPKGILRPLTGLSVEEMPDQRFEVLTSIYGIDSDSIYLSPAPLYHAAPIGFTAGTQTLGGTVVVMERFDPELSLKAIEDYGITVSQWVPTMFNRMLKLPEEARSRYDLSSHARAIHAAAPCPVDVKRRMIEWWGPIILEYYAGSEGNGMCAVETDEWLRKPGTVGKCLTATVHICDDDGEELPPGEPGTIFFEPPEDADLFEYHGDREKTLGSRHPVHPRWSTLGDVGYLDEDGYVFLTDRKAFMIISGGVNIYPQEIEDALILHPKVADVAVIGVPNEDLGEEVKAVVQLMPDFEESPDVGEELLAYARERVAHYKAPKSIDFEEQLPRLPTGKLYKRLLRDRYWTGRTSRIV